MSKDVVKIDFHGQVLTAVKHEGEPCVAMKPICDNLGLDWSGQLQRIKRDDVLGRVLKILPTRTEFGASRGFGENFDSEVSVLPVKYLNGWLFGLKTNMVKPEIRERLLEYKLECFDVLHKHFQPKYNHTLIEYEYYRSAEIYRLCGHTGREALTLAAKHVHDEFGYEITVPSGSYLSIKKITMLMYAGMHVEMGNGWIEKAMQIDGFLDEKNRPTSKGLLHCVTQGLPKGEEKWDVVVREKLERYVYPDWYEVRKGGGRLTRNHLLP